MRITRGAMSRLIDDLQAEQHALVLRILHANVDATDLDDVVRLAELGYRLAEVVQMLSERTARA